MKVTFYRVILRTTAPVSITAPQGLDFADAARARGSARAEEDVDLPLYRDHSGMPAVPATTVAGSIRAALPEGARDAVMGMVSGATAVASALYVLGGEVRDGVVGTRRSTAIDRTRGAARTSTYHDAKVLEAGAEVVVRLEGHDLGSHAAVVESTLASWQPRLGRGVTSGQGATELVEVRTGTLDLSLPADLLRYLNAGGPALVDAVVAGSRPLQLTVADGAVLVDETFEIVDGIHLGSGEAEKNALLTLRSADGQPLVPGSSLKGVLRSRCEYILRSIGVQACLEGQCGQCPTCALFGFTLKDSSQAEALGNRGLIAVRDAHVDSAHVTRRPHVAIDRVSGGARDSALFEVELVDEGRLRIVADALADVPAWAEGLLLAALADIDEGYVGIGGGTTRGQGTVRCVDGPISSRHGETVRTALASIRAEAKEHANVE